MDKCHKAENYAESVLNEARDNFDCSSIEKLIQDGDKIVNLPENAEEKFQCISAEKLIRQGGKIVNLPENAEEKFQCISAEKLIRQGGKIDDYEKSGIYEDDRSIWIKERIIPDDQPRGLFKCCFNINMCRKKKKKPRDFIIEFYNPHYGKF